MRLALPIDWYGYGDSKLLENGGLPGRWCLLKTPHRELAFIPADPPYLCRPHSNFSALSRARHKNQGVGKVGVGGSVCKASDFANALTQEQKPIEVAFHPAYNQIGPAIY